MHSNPVRKYFHCPCGMREAWNNAAWETCVYAMKKRGGLQSAGTTRLPSPWPGNQEWVVGSVLPSSQHGSGKVRSAPSRRRRQLPHEGVCYGCPLLMSVVGTLGWSEKSTSACACEVELKRGLASVTVLVVTYHEIIYIIIGVNGTLGRRLAGINT